MTIIYDYDYYDSKEQEQEQEIETYEKVYVRYPDFFKYKRRAAPSDDNAPVSKTAGRTWKINNAPFREVQA